MVDEAKDDGKKPERPRVLPMFTRKQIEGTEPLPVRRRMQDPEVQDALAEAAARGHWLVAIWSVELGHKIYLIRKCVDFPDEDVRKAIEMLEEDAGLAAMIKQADMKAREHDKGLAAE